MDVKHKKVRATLFFLVVIGLMILSASVLVHRAINEQLVGRREYVGLSDLFPFMPARKVQGVSAAVLVSNQTARYLSSLATEEEELNVYNSYREQALFWDDKLKSKNYESTMIRDDDLLNQLHNYNLLVLPFTLCLSEEQINSVKRFLEQGKGVILTHTSGNRTEDGKERSDWSLTSDVLGGYPFYPIEAGQASEVIYRYVSETPLTVNTPSGMATPVFTYDQPMAMNLVEGRTKEAAYWSSVKSEEKEEDLYLTYNTAIAYGNYMIGRFVWMGFSPGLVAEREDSWLMFDRLLDNSIRWVTNNTVAGVVGWDGYKAAATIALVPDRDFIRALSLTEILSENGLTPALLIDSNQATFFRMVLGQIASHGEIAPQFTDILPEQVLTKSEMERRKRQILAELQDRADTEIKGFSINQSRNLNFEQVGRSGYKYVWSIDEKGSLPITKRTNFQSLFRRRRDLVVFQQSARSDFEIFDVMGIREPSEVLSVLKNDFDSVYRTGGVYTITLNSHLLGDDEYRGTVQEFIDYIKSRNVIIGSPGEIAKIWLQHDNIKFRIQDNVGRITLMLTNEGTLRVPSTTIYLYPGIMPEHLSIRTERINVPIPQYEIIREEGRIDLYITNFGAGESRTYYLDLRR
jgi:hypothetical protein